MEQTLNQSEAFFLKYKKAIITVVVAIIVIIVGAVLYKTYIAEPNEQKASTAIAKGQAYFAQGLFQQALEGDNVASAFTNEAATQLQEYLAGKRREFTVALDLQGSAFQKAVWTELCAIPYGQTRTAADIAEALGKPGAHRSVGTAIRQNKLAPFVPSHRALAPNATGKQANIYRAFQALESKAR